MIAVSADCGLYQDGKMIGIPLPTSSIRNNSTVTRAGAPGSTFDLQTTQIGIDSISLPMHGKQITKFFTASTLAVALGFSVACNYSAAPEKNASMSEQETSHERTPAGGGTQTTNKRSVPVRPPVPENTRQGSAVPPAAEDQTRPHPQQQQAAQNGNPR